MSEDRITEILRHVSAMAQEFGEQRRELKEFRQDFNEFREETSTRLGNVEGQLSRVEGRLGGVEEQFIIFKHEQRQMSQLVSRIASAVITTSADVEELRDRMTLLEGKGT